MGTENFFQHFKYCRAYPENCHSLQKRQCSKVQRNADASDMYIPVYDDGLYARIDTPADAASFKTGSANDFGQCCDHIAVAASASKSATLNILFNNSTIKSATAATSISADAVITAAAHKQL